MALTDVYTPAKNRGGAPRGNTNALKHGFYSQRFHNPDFQSLTAYEFRGLQEEINLVRLAVKDVCDHYAGECTREESAHFLMLICTASSTLNRLIRTQSALKFDSADLMDALSEALEQVHADYLRDPEPQPVPQPVLPPRSVPAPAITPADPNDDDEYAELTFSSPGSEVEDPDPGMPTFAEFLASESASSVDNDDDDPSDEQTVYLSDSCRGEAVADALSAIASPSPAQVQPEVVSGCFREPPLPPPPKKKKADPPYATFRFFPPTDPF